MEEVENSFAGGLHNAEILCSLAWLANESGSTSEAEQVETETLQGIDLNNVEAEIHGQSGREHQGQVGIPQAQAEAVTNPVCTLEMHGFAGCLLLDKLCCELELCCMCPVCRVLL